MKNHESSPLPNPRGRGTGDNPRNRFESIEYVPDIETRASLSRVNTQYLEDSSCSIISSNDSPDTPFDISINPYRGCEHGCVYCYARPTHEYLGYSAGLDFETKIVIKKDAASLLEKALSAPGWKPQKLGLSGVTDPYQPVEKHLNLTRQCLEVLVKFRHPVSIVTKNSLITRDIDLLAQLAKWQCIVVGISMTSLNPELTNVMEPRTSRPQRRLDTVARLADAGIPVGVIVAPVIPGLNDEEIPEIIRRATEHGAQWMHYQALRLPYAVKDLFVDWLERYYPSRKEKILQRIRDMRGGKLNDFRHGLRMKGTGIWAEQFNNLFRLGLRKAGLKMEFPALNAAHFRRPGPRQLELF